MEFTQKRRTVEETVKIINSCYKEADKQVHTKYRKSRSGLSKDRIKISFQQVIDGNCSTLDLRSTDGKKLYGLTFSR